MSDVLAEGRNAAMQVTIVHKTLTSVVSIFNQEVLMTELGRISEIILTN